MHKDVTDRLRTRFQTLDADGDGYLTGDDFDAEVNHILEATNVPETAPRARLLRSVYQVFWWAMVVHLDGGHSGKISFDEYAKTVHEAGLFKTFGRARAEAVDRFADFDDDGWITRDDYMAVMVADRFDEAAARATFDAMDTGGQGRIPAGRFAEMIVEFYDIPGTADAAQRLVPPK
jgi:Ca2+-binding EF-hand superfamily protein